MKQNTIGIQVKTMFQCVGISLQNEFMISVEYKPTSKSVVRINKLFSFWINKRSNVNPQIDILVCSFTDNKPDKPSKQISVIEITPKESQTAELIQLIFKYLKICAKQETRGGEFNSAFYSVPGSFTESQKQMVVEAGIMANIQMKNIDEHVAYALAFSRIHEVQPKETILIFDLSEGRLEVALIITSEGELEIKFRGSNNQVNNNYVPNNITEIELNKQWVEYGQPIVQSVLDDQKKINNVALVASYPNTRMMHLKSLFVEFFEKKNIKVSININSEWEIAYGAAIMGCKFDEDFYFLLTDEVEDIYDRVKKLDPQQQINIMQQLIVESKTLFKKYCRETNQFKDQEYKTQFDLISSPANHNEIDQCNKYIQINYDKNKYRGYTLYLNLVEQIKGLKNPDPTDIDDDNKSQLLLKLKEIEAPNIFHWIGLLIKLEQKKEVEVAYKLFKLKEEDEKFFNSVIQQIYQILPKAESILYQHCAPQGLREKVQELYNNLEMITEFSYQNSEQLFQEIYDQDVSFFKDLYQYLEKIYPRILQLKAPQAYNVFSMHSWSQIKSLFVSKSSLMTKLDIEAFMTIDAKYDALTAEKDIINSYQQENILVKEDICTLLFDYIKRGFNFSKLIDILSKCKSDDQKQIDCYLTKSVLINLLIKNSDSDLGLLLFELCSRFMPVPLISYDWEDNKLFVWKELLESIPKGSGIFNFKISNDLILGPRGCTTLANSLFNKDFEMHTNMLTNQGSIDLQFDYNPASLFYVPVADAHGYLDFPILRRVYDLFDIFIIHIVNREEDKLQLNEEIRYIRRINKDSLIIVLEHVSDFIGDEYDIQKLSEKQYMIRSKPHDKLLPQVLIKLKDQIYEIAINQISQKENYLQNISERIQSLEQETIQLKQQYGIDYSQ